MKNKTLLGCGVSCVLLGLIPASCAPGGSAGERSGKASEPIFYGKPDTDDEACVAIQLPGGLCTGTIIAKKGSTGYVLTAAHCFERQPPPSAVQVGQGNDPFAQNPGGGADVVYPVISYAVHPQYRPGDYDIALVTIGEATNAPVIPALQPTEDTLNVGTPVEFVGYGRTESETLGIRLTVNGTISNSPYSASPALGPRQFEYVQTPDVGGPCQGDSGGPAFVGTGPNKRVAGVTSYGDADCTIFGVSSRTSGYWADFIAPRIGATTMPPPPATCSECIGTATAANTGACRTSWARCEKGACTRPTDCCATFLDCYTDCGENDAACQNSCFATFPNGKSQYDAYSSCICDQQCTTACTAECVVDPGPDTTTCNGCTEVKGPTSCSAQITACENSAACRGYSECYAAASSAAELSACESQNPGGGALLNAYFDCLCNTACKTECTAECVDTTGVACGFSSVSEGGSCDACWQKSCCAEGKACAENTACLDCALDPNCVDDPMFQTFLGCIDTNCKTECYGDGGTAGTGGTNGASGSGGTAGTAGESGSGGTAGESGTSGTAGTGATVAPRQEDDDDGGGGCAITPASSGSRSAPAFLLAALFALTAAGRRRKSPR
jgi:hypothetical protein